MCSFPSDAAASSQRWQRNLRGAFVIFPPLSSSLTVQTWLGLYSIYHIHQGSQAWPSFTSQNELSHFCPTELSCRGGWGETDGRGQTGTGLGSDWLRLCYCITEVDSFCPGDSPISMQELVWRIAAARFSWGVFGLGLYSSNQRKGLVSLTVQSERGLMTYFKKYLMSIITDHLDPNVRLSVAIF